MIAETRVTIVGTSVFAGLDSSSILLVASSFVFLTRPPAGHNLHRNPRRLRGRVIHALRRFHEVLGRGVGDVDERLRIAIGERKPGVGSPGTELEFAL